MWRGFVEKLCPLTDISFIPRGSKRFGNFVNVNFVRKKIDSLREHYTSFPWVTRKCCYLYLENRESILTVARNFFFLYLNEVIPANFSNSWDTVKLAHAYYVFPLWSRQVKLRLECDWKLKSDTSEFVGQLIHSVKALFKWGIVSM